MGSGVVAGGAGGGLGVVFTASGMRRDGATWAWMIPRDGGGQAGGPGSPLQETMTCSVQFSSSQWHPGSCGGLRHLVACLSGPFPPGMTSSKGSAVRGPHSSRWQIQSRSSTLTLSQQICLHCFSQFASSIPVQRQPPLVSLRMVSVGKHRENTIIRGFPSLRGGFSPWERMKSPWWGGLGKQHKEWERGGVGGRWGAELGPRGATSG